MAKTYKPRKYAKKRYTTAKTAVSKSVKDYVKSQLHKTVEKKYFSMTGSGTLNNNVATAQYGAIFDMGLIPAYDPASTTVQEGSLGQARVKNDIKLTKVTFTLWLKNNSAFNQFIRLLVLRNTNMYEEYVSDGQNMYMDQTGTQVPYSTALLQGQRLWPNHDMTQKRADLYCDKILPLPYDTSHEGGNIPISYIRKLTFSKYLNQHITYENASDDISKISPKGGRYIIFFHQIHGQTATADNCSVSFEWRLDQFYEE